MRVNSRKCHAAYHTRNIRFERKHFASRWKRIYLFNDGIRTHTRRKFVVSCEIKWIWSTSHCAWSIFIGLGSHKIHRVAFVISRFCWHRKMLRELSIRWAIISDSLFHSNIYNSSGKYLANPALNRFVTLLNCVRHFSLSYCLISPPGFICHCVMSIYLAITSARWRFLTFLLTPPHYVHVARYLRFINVARFRDRLPRPLDNTNFRVGNIN